MTSLLFKETPRLKKAVGLINDLDASRFPALLLRIFQKLHVKGERTFSEEEEVKLQKTLNLTSEELELVIETLEFFLHQAAYHASKPAVLSQQLLSLNLASDKVSAITELWNEKAKETLSKLRQHTICPRQLETINWRLNLQMSQTTKSHMNLPNAMFELGISDENASEKEKVRLEFTHDELYQFYNQLETIQGQLDSLS